MRFVIMVVMFCFLCGCNAAKNNGFNDPSVDWSQIKVESKALNCNTVIPLGDTGYSFYYDKEKWAITEEEDWALTFENRFGAASAHVVFERLQAPMDRIPQYVTSQFKKMFGNASLSNSTKKVVNGVIVNSYTVSYNVDYVEMKVLCYSTSGKSGTVQIRAFTSGNIFDEIRPELEEFLNGIAGGIS
jgi:hypothetical protein